MFALINDARIANGKTRLGWINPNLYRLAEIDQNKYFNDVVKGYNQGAFTDHGVAFNAAQGWDACTGWGTPKFDALFDAFVNIEQVLGD
ncbi:hypothetical protein RFI_02896 [Reticulomyxa filosa]|uniref:subtilisin n=1 Tax=Reticulomyxa filosa TaxID=46433 RepID=X6P7V5_RETFI|nr:hypothetical protein RFI_02896 [Reticulomyxa filosa]|eukprot:ETO34198.1 hypothetical protein RFI_02896 [Reticulomyxa filosa]